MKVTRFRVENFRNIDDSGWIPVNRVTAFVGRNESGKTTLLKALHKFNPATAEPVNPQRDFPRDRFTSDFDDPAKWSFCSVEFELDEAFRADIRSLVDGVEPPVSAICTRWYDGDLSVELSPEIAEGSLPPSEIAAGLAAFASSARRLEKVGDEGEDAAAERRSTLATWATGWRDRLNGVADLTGHAELLETLREEAETRSTPQTADMVETLLNVIEPVWSAVQKDPAGPQIKALIAERMPVFVYFENFGILDSAIYLPRFLEDQEATPSDPRVRTISAMFKHVRLSADDIASLAREEAREQKAVGAAVTAQVIERDRQRKDERAIKLSSASLDITRKFSAWWSQRRHHIRYDADGDYFRIWVSDDRRPGVEIELEERSKGFQWFFSFYLVFLVEAEEGHKHAVLLLDEPGIHLHPTAQQELISFFDNLSEKNQLLYSTHSPFLIDGENLHRIRPVVEDETGHSHISVGEWPRDRDTIFPLQAAAGYAMVRGLFQHRDNLLVEGMTDYYLLTLLAQQARASGRESLSEEIYVTPCGGTKMVGHLASLFLGQDVRPVILLDGDAAGTSRRDALTKELYTGHPGRIVMVNEVLSEPSAEIEDLLGAELLLDAANAALGLKLKLTEADRSAGNSVAQIVAAAKRGKVVLPDGWKPTTALHLVRQWAERGERFPDEVLSRAQLLFRAINTAFAQPS